jgi:hypothetical protein
MSRAAAVIASVSSRNRTSTPVGTPRPTLPSAVARSTGVATATYAASAKVDTTVAHMSVPRSRTLE